MHAFGISWMNKAIRERQCHMGVSADSAQQAIKLLVVHTCCPHWLYVWKLFGPAVNGANIFKTDFTSTSPTRVLKLLNKSIIYRSYTQLKLLTGKSITSGCSSIKC